LGAKSGRAGGAKLILGATVSPRRLLRSLGPALLRHQQPAWQVRSIITWLDAVPARDSKCWTARAYHARCLVHMAAQRPDERHVPLRKAFGAAQQAVALQDKHHETWPATKEVAAALGDEKLLSAATKQVEKSRPPPAPGPTR